MEKETFSSPDAKPGVSFRTSTSSAQNFGTPYQFNQPGVRAKDLFTHPVEWFKYRFRGEQLVGSIMMLFNMYSTFELMLNGLEKKDFTRTYGGASATALTAWAFLSARGAKLPEGKNSSQRFIDTITHPEQSAVQFAWLASFPINALLISGDFYHGYKDQQSHQNADLKKIGMSRFTEGGANLIGSALVTSSLFKNQDALKNQKPITWRRSESSKQSFGLHLKEVSRFAFHYDKGGLLGRSLFMAAKIGRVYEAAKSIQLKKAGETSNSVQGGSELLRSSIVGMCILITQAYYEYNRVYQDTVNSGQPKQNLARKV